MVFHRRRAPWSVFRLVSENPIITHAFTAHIDPFCSGSSPVIQSNVFEQSGSSGALLTASNIHRIRPSQRAFQYNLIKLLIVMLT